MEMKAECKLVEKRGGERQGWKIFTPTSPCLSTETSYFAQQYGKMYSSLQLTGEEMDSEAKYIKITMLCVLYTVKY